MRYYVYSRYALLDEGIELDDVDKRIEFIVEEVHYNKLIFDIMDRPIIRKSDLLDMLDRGMTREEIAEYYGLSLGSIQRVFRDAKLTGKRAVIRKYTFEDDIPKQIPPSDGLVASPYTSNPNPARTTTDNAVKTTAS